MHTHDCGGMLAQGAKSVIACATHAVFSPPACERLGNVELFDEVRKVF